MLRASRQSGRPSTWMRLLALFGILLFGAVSTVQACHSHDEVLLTAGTHQTLEDAHPAGTPQTAAVNCPLCVAMHSALPVTRTLTQVAPLCAEPPPPLVRRTPRLFDWRFDLASRPPPAASPLV